VAGDFSTHFDALKDILGLDNIELLKGTGQITDFEQGILRKAATSLTRSMSDAEFKIVYKEVSDVLRKAKERNSEFNGANEDFNVTDEEISELKQKYPDMSEEEIRSTLGGFKEVGGDTNKAALSPLAASIVQQESGGNYGAIGQPVSGGHRALGKYQIMPNYHFHKIGLKDTPADHKKFLESPELQDQLFNIIIDDLNKR